MMQSCRTLHSEAEEMKICFVCGDNTNKMKRHERYKHIPSMKKKGKFQKDDSESDSDDSLKNSKSKKKTTPQRASSRVPAAGGRQTRNQNPKTFAASLCKVMELPDTPDDPFLQIFSRAHYCNECMAKVREAHSAQVELERIQARIAEAKVDFEIDFSKHLERLPARKNFYRNHPAIQVYENDIKLILDYNGTEKKRKPASPAKKETAQPQRERRQAAINSSIKLKRKVEESESGGSEQEEEEEEKVVVKVKKSKKEEQIEDVETLPENSAALENEKEEQDVSKSDENDGVTTEAEMKEEEDSEAKMADNGSNDVKEEEEKPEEIVKVKKDPNLKCPHCPVPRYFNIPANLEEHINKCHNYNCDTCDKTFQFEAALKKHKAHAHVHKTTTEGTDGKLGYICGFCDQEFQVKKYLEDHIDRHQEAKPLNCHQCGRGFSRKESLQKAFQIFKGEPVEPCNRCGKNLNLKDYIEHNKSLKQ